jgi:hypothetical protein
MSGETTGGGWAGGACANAGVAMAMAMSIKLDPRSLDSLPRMVVPRRYFFRL